MHKSISNQTFVAVIAVIVVVVAGALWWVYRAPSAHAETPGPVGRPSAKGEDRGPTADDLKKIQEWKKTHPNAIMDNR